jgi:hypothetical protein
MRQEAVVEVVVLKEEQVQLLLELAEMLVYL